MEFIEVPVMKKTILRIIGISAVVLALCVVLLILIGFIDVLGKEADKFHSPGKPYAVFYPPELSAADSPSGSSPAVLLIHEWWGLNAGHIEKAQALAQEGYVVYVPDAYRGRLAQTVPGALFLVFTRPDSDIFLRIDETYEAMLADPAVDASRNAVAGFCFGGRQAMHLGIRDGRPAATAIFYGSGLVGDPVEVGLLGENGPVLGIFGADDSSIPPDERAAFKAALESRGVVYQQTVYDDVGHAFVKADNLYRAGPSSQAWQEFLGFLGAVLDR